MSQIHYDGLAGFRAKLDSRQPLTKDDAAAAMALPHTIKELRRHEYIIREEETPRYCCVIVSGFAMRHKVAGNGARQIFSFHMRGDAVDLHNSLLARADHNVEMLSAGRAAFIPVDAIRALALDRPTVALAMWYDTLVDSAVFREWTLNISRRDARSRLSHLLCEFALRLKFAGLGEASDYELPMTQEELADALGLTSIHVSRTLKSLTTEGLLVRTARSVKITDWDRLTKLGDFDSGYLHLRDEP